MALGAALGIVKANSENIVKMMAANSIRNMLASNSNRFLNSMTIEANRIEEIIYSILPVAIFQE